MRINHIHNIWKRIHHYYTLFFVLFESFYSYFFVGEENSFTAGRMGAIELILNILKKHLSNEKICQFGCAALNFIVIIGMHTLIYILIVFNI